MARPAASEQLGRILSMVPWIAGADGPTVDEIAERFHIAREVVVADLGLAVMVGVYPFTPADYLDVIIDDEERVHITYGNFFERPLRLTSIEGLGVLAAGLVAAAQQGHEPDGALARAMAKIATALRIDLDAQLQVTVSSQLEATRAALEAAVADGRAVDIEYLVESRGEQTQRRIEPIQVFRDGAHHYVEAYCHRSAADRVFRLDRIVSHATVDAAEAIATRPEPSAPAVAFDDRVPRAVVEIPVESRWIEQQVHAEAAVELDDGGVRLTVPVSGPAWLERLLLQAGPRARVVEGAATDLAAQAAQRILERYEAPRP